MNRVVSPRQRWRVNLPVVIWVWLCLYVAVTSFQYLISGEQISLLRFFFNGGLLLVALLDIARRQVAEVFQHSQESIIIADSKGTILNVNPAFTRITGYALEEARGKNPRILSSGRQNRQFYEDLFKQLRAEGFWSGQFWNKRKNGEHYLQRGTISAVFGDSGKPEHYIAIMEDASVYREAEERIQALANYDALGHYYGDELLKAVCKRLKLHVKETDTLCRFGGDEFILLMQGGAKEAGQLAQRLIDAIKPVFDIEGARLHVGASVGVAVLFLDGDTLGELIQAADTAMYQAKNEGRGRVSFFAKSMQDKVQFRVALKPALQKAISCSGSQT